MNVKRKGTAGERELAALLTAHGLHPQRGDQRYVGGLHNPDIALDMDGTPIQVEVKRVRRARESRQRGNESPLHGARDDERQLAPR